MPILPQVVNICDQCHLRAVTSSGFDCPEIKTVKYVISSYESDRRSLVPIHGGLEFLSCLISIQMQIKFLQDFKLGEFHCQPSCGLGQLRWRSYCAGGRLIHKHQCPLISINNFTIISGTVCLEDHRISQMTMATPCHRSGFIGSAMSKSWQGTFPKDTPGLTQVFIIKIRLLIQSYLMQYKQN